MNNYRCKSVGIVGSGIQGVCIGLQLIKKGIPVTIFDRNDPLSSSFKPASYGNAGHFSPYAVLQFNRPDVLYDVPKMLLSSYGPLALKWNYIPKMIPWFINYLKNFNKKSMLHTAKYMHQILSLSNDAYEEIFREIDTSNLVKKNGIIYVWTNKNLKSRELEIKVRRDLGIKQKLLTQKEILEIEPNLNPVFDAGVIYEDAMHAKDPHKILKEIFKLFLKKGGKFIQEDIKSIKQNNEDQTTIVANNKQYFFEKSIIASGAFSKNLTDQLGEKIPLDTERGYHVHFKNMENLISRPVIFLDRGFGMTPMSQGLRAVGTVELGGLKNPPSKKRIDYIIRCAKELLPQLREHHDEWLGFRPTLPDFLPILGPSLKNKNIIYAFGHHHLGWTLGAITGKIISGIAAGEKTNLDLSPYSSKDLIRNFLSKNYLAYLFLVLAALFWSGNFIVGKFATLFEIPPLTLNVFRWISVWFILIPFTYTEIYNNLSYIKKNWLVISFMGVITISTFNSVVYFALNYTQVINAVLMLAAIPAATIVLSSLMKIEKTNIFKFLDCCCQL